MAVEDADHHHCIHSFLSSPCLTFPAILIKMLLRQAVLNWLLTRASAQKSWDTTTYNRIPRFPCVAVVGEAVRKVIGLLLFTGRGELQKMVAVFPDTRG